MLKILPTRFNIPYPVTSMKQLRYRVQGKPQNPSYTPSTIDTGTTQQQLCHELAKTGHLKTLFLKLQSQIDSNCSNKPSNACKSRKKRRRKKKKKYSSSSATSDSSSSCTESE
nr:hypothetical protein [TTV-like mini virus]